MKIYFPKSAIPAFLNYINTDNNDTVYQFTSAKRWLFDHNALINQITKWNEELYWIKPYYAIKSNPSPEMLETLTMNNVGVDVASINETEIALKYTSPENIIYTNPHTTPHEKSIMKDYLTTSVDIKVVDSMCELKKLIEYNIKPKKVLVRINSNIQLANVKFDSKFGATMEDAFEIVDYALLHNMPMKGVSFHIGSGGKFSRENAYKKVISYALPLLEYIKKSLRNGDGDGSGSEKELPILDIGGGLLYDTDIKKALLWTKDLPFTMISELGRYFSEPSYHLLTQVTAKTKRGLFIDNGVYHELNVFHRDHWHFPTLTHYYENGKIYPIGYMVETANSDYDSNSDGSSDGSSDCCDGRIDYNSTEKIQVFGPTCDSYDTLNECILPKNIEVGDWFFLNNMGAYTSAGKVDFNGIYSASSY
jgi:ornithine decarboxylase